LSGLRSRKTGDRPPLMKESEQKAEELECLCVDDFMKSLIREALFFYVLERNFET
jgi:hypothetical protein